MEKTGVDVKSYLRERSGLVSSYLESYFSKPFAPPSPPVIGEAMAYSLMAGGKRLRPVLAMASYEACGGKPEDILPCAASLEVIHTYSLIHDDLPVMDDDDLRRGRPTNHKVFGEAIAVLAGDALLTEAFLMVLAMRGKVSDTSLIEAIREISQASGVRGMVGGQAQDIISEGAEPDAETLEYIHRHKTAELIKASLRLGGILAEANDQKMEALSRYGEDLGLAFQIVDDVLDVSGDTETMGKPAGSDTEKRKMTYPAMYGVEESMRVAEQHIQDAMRALEVFGQEADPLRAIARFIIERNN